MTIFDKLDPRERVLIEGTVKPLRVWVNGDILNTDGGLEISWGVPDWNNIGVSMLTHHISDHLNKNYRDKAQTHISSDLYREVREFLESLPPGNFKKIIRLDTKYITITRKRHETNPV